MISAMSTSSVAPRSGGASFAPQSAALHPSLRDLVLALIAGVVAGLAIAGPVGGTAIEVADANSVLFDEIRADQIGQLTILSVSGEISGGSGSVKVEVWSGQRKLGETSVAVAAGRFRAELSMQLPPGGLPTEVSVSAALPGGSMAALQAPVLLPGPRGSGEWVDPSTGRTMRPVTRR